MVNFLEMVHFSCFRNKNPVSNYTVAEILKTFDVNKVVGKKFDCTDDSLVSLIRVPVLLNKHRVYAIVDSGASISCISVDMAKGLEMKEGIELKMANRYSIKTPVTTVEVQLGRKVIVTTVGVITMDDDFILGLDLMNTFGISLANLPFLFPDDDRLFLVERESVAVKRTLKGMTRIDENELKWLMEEISEELKKIQVFRKTQLIRIQKEDLMQNLKRILNLCICHSTKHRSWLKMLFH